MLRGMIILFRVISSMKIHDVFRCLRNFTTGHWQWSFMRAKACWSSNPNLIECNVISLHHGSALVLAFNTIYMQHSAFEGVWVDWELHHALNSFRELSFKGKCILCRKYSRFIHKPIPVCSSLFLRSNESKVISLAPIYLELSFGYIIYSSVDSHCWQLKNEFISQIS